MIEFFQKLFVADFMPHGHCLFWQPGVLWLHIISDGLTTLAYYSIPIAMFVFVRKREEFHYQWVFYMFALFILACGTTHLLNIWTLWEPIYRFEGVVKLFTAGLSVATAVMLWPLIPRALRMPKQSELESEILARKTYEKQLIAAHDELEQLVRKRTEALETANAQLKKEIEERMQVEEELLLKRQQLELTLWASDLGMWDWDVINNKRVVNQWVKQLGYNSTEFPQKEDWESVVHPDDLPVKMKQLDRYLKGEIPFYEAEFRQRAQDGEYRWILSRGKITEWDENQRPARLTGTYLNITERKQAEKELRESQSQLAGIFASAMDAIITVDQTQQIMYFNASAEKMFECPEADAIGQPLNRFIPELFRDLHSRHIQQFGDTGFTNRKMSTPIQLSGLRAGGQEFPIEASISQVKAGNQFLYTVILRDITEKLQKEQELRFLATVLENVSEAVISTDMEFVINWWNYAAEKMYCFKSEEVIGKSMNSIIHTRYEDTDEETVRQQFLDNGMWRGEVIQDHKNGKTMNVFASVSKVYNAGMQPIGVVALNRDITEQKQQKAKLAKYAHDLQRSNTELENFAYIVSHDLKEPLRGLQNYAGFIIEDYNDVLDDPGKEKLKTLQMLTLRMDQQLESLLQYSRVGRVDLAFAKTDLGLIVQRVLERLKFTIEESSTNVLIPRKMPIVYCDNARIAEVFQNLILNAIKYNDKPNPTVEIGYIQPDESGTIEPDAEMVSIYIKDNGIGIKEKHYDTIFRIFKRLHARDKFGGGTGAGLTIVQKIIERHGGKIWLNSEINEGTTFYFTLSENKNEAKNTPDINR